MKCRTCGKCGANLDFGERCDCEKEAQEVRAAQKQKDKEGEGLKNGRT